MKEDEKRELDGIPLMDAGQMDFVNRLRSIPLGPIDESKHSNLFLQSPRDQLIYDCGYAAGVEVTLRSQSVQLRRYRLVGAVATVVIALLSGYAWQNGSNIHQSASQVQSSELKGTKDEEIGSSASSPIRQLAAQWLAVQTHTDLAKSQSRQLTTSSQSIESTTNSLPATLPLPDPISNPEQLRSNSYSNVLEWGV